MHCFATIDEQQAFFDNVPPFPVNAAEVRALLLDGAIDPIEYATGVGDEAARAPAFIREKSDVGSSRHWAGSSTSAQTQALRGAHSQWGTTGAGPGTDSRP